jgi:CubicO group peptidase (beta-lactamase class C family)
MPQQRGTRSRSTAPADRGNTLPARPDRTVERFRNLPLQFAPGTRYSYSNAGYQLLAYLIERTSGQRYEDFLRESIFEPLGMKESGSATHAPILPSLASGYITGPGDAPLNAPFIDLSNGMGAGSLYSTIGDLHRWMRALFGGNLLSPASLTKMTTPVTTTPQGPGYEGGYGYGVIVRTSADGRREFYHGGSVPGFSSVLSYYPVTSHHRGPEQPARSVR